MISLSNRGFPMLHLFAGGDYITYNANRSLRDVEPDVNIWVRTLDNAELEEETV